MTERDRAIKIVVLEPDPVSAAMDREALVAEEGVELVAIVPTATRLLDEVVRCKPEVAVLDISGLDGEITAMMRELLARAPECCVIVTGADTPPPVVSRAVTAGARSFLLRPYEPRDLVATINNAYASHLELRRLQRSERTGANATRGSVIAVYSPKGGVGCTTIATNLASALAERAKNGVGIVDLDLQFGDVGIALDLRAPNSVADLLERVDEIDAALIEETFVSHRSGIRALLAPEHLAFVERIDPNAIVRALDRLRDHFRFVVCDLSSSFDELTLAVLRTADRVILVTTPELPALKNLKRVMASTSAQLLDERSLIVVNRAPAKAGISLAEVERSLGRTAAITIPSEGVAVTDAINQGISLFDPRARARVGREFRRLADIIVRGRGRQAAPDVARSTSTA